MKKNLLILSIVVLLLVCIILGSFLFFGNEKLSHRLTKHKSGVSIEHAKIDSLEFVADSLFYETERMKVIIQTLDETGYYLVIDTKAKVFQLRKNNIVIREGPCAVGKGYTSAGNRSWNFQTPTGERKIVSKNENPTWFRPTWYWQEKGKSVPKDFITFSPNMPEEERKEAFRIMSKDEKDYVRAVPGELGRYSLGLGDGYYIHYGKGLGQAVSHGCVRVGADDLEAIYKVLQIGDPVFIY